MRHCLAEKYRGWGLYPEFAVKCPGLNNLHDISWITKNTFRLQVLALSCASPDRSVSKSIRVSGYLPNLDKKIPIHQII